MSDRYNPKLVRQLLAAAKRPPVARFRNAASLMAWLNDYKPKKKVLRKAKP